MTFIGVSRLLFVRQARYLRREKERKNNETLGTISVRELHVIAGQETRAKIIALRRRRTLRELTKNVAM